MPAGLLRPAGSLNHYRPDLGTPKRFNLVGVRSRLRSAGFVIPKPWAYLRGPSDMRTDMADALPELNSNAGLHQKFSTEADSG
jgi:hypothetical protein